MSREAEAWAWELPLPPTEHLVALFLARHANEAFYCSVSERVIALGCRISERSVRRITAALAAAGYLAIEARFDGRGRASNGYRLLIHNPRTNCPGVPAIHDQGYRPPVTMGTGHPRPGVPATDDRGTTYSVVVLKPLLRTGGEVSSSVGGAAIDRVGSGSALCFSGMLSNAQRSAIERALKGLKIEQAQAILDELAGRMEQGKVERPVGYCFSIVERFRRGEFHPELGLAIARRRQQDRKRTVQFSTPRAAEEMRGDRTIRASPEEIRELLEPIRLRLNGPKNDDKQAADEPSMDGSLRAAD